MSSQQRSWPTKEAQQTNSGQNTALGPSNPHVAALAVSPVRRAIQGVGNALLPPQGLADGSHQSRAQKGQHLIYNWPGGLSGLNFDSLLPSSLPSTTVPMVWEFLQA